MATVARTLDSYFRQSATAVINFVADEFVTRIHTDDGWYVEPPPTQSLMEAVRQIRLWAGNSYEVAVIEDLENSELSPVSRHRKERGKSKNPRLMVQDAVRAAALDKREVAAGRLRCVGKRCA